MPTDWPLASETACQSHALPAVASLLMPCVVAGHGGPAQCACMPPEMGCCEAQSRSQRRACASEPGAIFFAQAPEEQGLWRNTGEERPASSGPAVCPLYGLRGPVFECEAKVERRPLAGCGSRRAGRRPGLSVHLAVAQRVMIPPGRESDDDRAPQHVIACSTAAGLSLRLLPLACRLLPVARNGSLTIQNSLASPPPRSAAIPAPLAPA